MHPFYSLSEIFRGWGGALHYTLWCNSSPISEKDCIKESRLKWTIVLYTEENVKDFSFLKFCSKCKL